MGLSVHRPVPGQMLVDTALAQADAPGRPLKSARHCGFERIQAGRTLILMDVGAPPPTGLDAGAHAGTLSFELSVGRERMIVNCGSVSGLEPAQGGPQAAAWSLALRGTAAHSTLTIDETNSSEAVTDGGLGRRPAKVTVDRQEEDGAVLIDASHDGYRRPFGLTHHRRLYISVGGDDIRGEDRLEGRGGRPFAVRFHLHPSVQVSAVQGGAAALLRLGGGAGWRLRASGGSLAIEASAYCGVGRAMRRASPVVTPGQRPPDGTATPTQRGPPSGAQRGAGGAARGWSAAPAKPARIPPASGPATGWGAWPTRGPAGTIRFSRGSTGRAPRPPRRQASSRA